MGYSADPSRSLVLDNRIAKALWLGAEALP
jgi:hypothetical protein